MTKIVVLRILQAVSSLYGAKHPGRPMSFSIAASYPYMCSQLAALSIIGRGKIYGRIEMSVFLDIRSADGSCISTYWSANHAIA